jgi:metal-responsive CopG/Arc/MetJ family transcriptional regulator
VSILAQLKNIPTNKTKTVCVSIDQQEVNKFDEMCERYAKSRSQMVALAMKTFRELVEAETAKKDLVAA